MIAFIGKAILIAAVLLMGLLMGMVLLTYAVYFFNINGVRDYDYNESETFTDFPECEQAED